MEVDIRVPVLMHVYTSVATGSSYSDYLGYLGHFLLGSKWVSPGHTYLYARLGLVIVCIEKTAMKDQYSLMEQSLIFQGS